MKLIILLQPVEGMVSHQLEQNRIDGEKTILQNLTEAQSKEHETFSFGLHEVIIVKNVIHEGIFVLIFRCTAWMSLSVQVMEPIRRRMLRQ